MGLNPTCDRCGNPIAQKDADPQEFLDDLRYEYAGISCILCDECSKKFRDFKEHLKEKVERFKKNQKEAFLRNVIG